jgi:hypothetical protein
VDPGTAGIIGGGVSAGVALGLIAVKLIEVFWSKKKHGADDAKPAIDDRLLDAVKEMTAILRKIEERLIGSSYEIGQQSDTLARLEASQVALHRRFDAITGVR